MSLDLPASVERDLELYAQAEHISSAEAAANLIRDALKAAKRKSEDMIVTDADIEAYYKAFPGFKALEDVTDEQWDQVLKRARRMSKQGLSVRG